MMLYDHNQDMLTSIAVTAIDINPFNIVLTIKIYQGKLMGYTSINIRS